MTIPRSSQCQEKDLPIYEAYTQYVEAANSLRSHNKSQSLFKAAASLTVLISFIASCYTFSFAPESAHPAFRIFLFSLFSCVGIALFWFFDMIVTEKKIGAAVMRGLNLERKNRWIPPFYHTVNKMCHMLGYVNIKTMFYIGCMTIELLVLAASFSYTLVSWGFPLCALLVIIFSIVLVSLFFLLLTILNRKMDPYQRRFLAEKAQEDQRELPEIACYGKNLVFNLYHNLMLFSHQYDRITTKHRSIALVWLFCSMGALFCIHAGKASFFSSSLLIGTLIVALIGVLGISLIWSLDIELYHRFWCATYIQELDMEKRYSFLPSHTRMEQPRKLLAHWKAYVMMGAFLLATGALLNCFSFHQYQVNVILSMAPFYLFALCGLAFLMKRSYAKIHGRFMALLQAS